MIPRPQTCIWLGIPFSSPVAARHVHAVGPDLTWFWLQGTWTATTRIIIPAAARLKLASQPLPLKRDHPLAFPRGWPCTLFLFPASQPSLHPAHKDGSYPLCVGIFLKKVVLPKTGVVSQSANARKTAFSARQVLDI